MKSLRKFATFDDLKSSETKATKYAERLKKHSEFEKFIMNIRSIKVLQSKKSLPK